MARTPQEVFAHHAQALGAGDLDEIVADYSDDGVFISPAGVLRGKDGIRAAFTRLLADVPDARWDLKTQLYEGTCCSWSGPRTLAPPGWTTALTRSSSRTG